MATGAHVEWNLLRRLRILVDDGVTDHRHVHSLLVDARKLMDLSSQYEDSTLRMFADWVAHTDLSRKRLPMTAVLNAIETEFLERTNGRKWRTTAWEKLIPLRSSMRTFLISAGLGTQTVDDDDAWLLFAKSFVEIVSDCPLIPPNSIHIKSIELTRAGLYPLINGQSLVSVNWIITPHVGGPITRCVSVEPCLFESSTGTISLDFVAEHTASSGWQITIG